MALLSSFKKNSAAIKNGDWVSPGVEYADLMIQTRGYTDEYFDASAARTADAARKSGELTAKVDNATARQINIGLVIDFLIIDVKGIVDDTGAAIGIDEFKALLRNPDYYDLVAACQKAAAKVGLIRAERTADAVKN